MRAGEQAAGQRHVQHGQGDNRHHQAGDKEADPHFGVDHAVAAAARGTLHHAMVHRIDADRQGGRSVGQ